MSKLPTVYSALQRYTLLSTQSVLLSGPVYTSALQALRVWALVIPFSGVGVLDDASCLWALEFAVDASALQALGVLADVSTVPTSGVPADTTPVLVSEVLADASAVPALILAPPGWLQQSSEPASPVTDCCSSPLLSVSTKFVLLRLQCCTPVDLHRASAVGRWPCAPAARLRPELQPCHRQPPGQLPEGFLLRSHSAEDIHFRSRPPVRPPEGF